MLAATPGSSSSDARSAISLVAAVPRPRSTRENQPVMAEKVWTRAHVPNAAGPEASEQQG